MDELVFREEVYAVVGAAIEVHRSLGAGFLEAVYQEAMERELLLREIAFKAQRELVIHYKGQPLGKSYVCDLLCFDKVLVELKAMDRLTGREEAQLINYLKAAGLPVGLLINFGAHGKLDWRRLVKSQ
ncbi:MAG: NADH:ubiquinone oxidoreductase [Thiobacillus sp. SCN 63-374]|nr:MAG: NADH:ubiquinone oxidoreductase [Thiobacillus sp. SCN 63-374]